MIEFIDLNAPWVPASARPFRVGDRVRIRLSGECRRHPLPESLYGRLDIVGHHPNEDGLTGTVAMFLEPIADGHMVYVGTDDTFDIGSGKETRRWISYAASELELLTPAPEAEACPS